MRKYIALLIVSVFLFNTGGYYLYFSILQYNAQQEIAQEIRKGLQEKDLTLIMLPLNHQEDISWIKHSKEFRYKGEMYDVVKIKVLNHTKMYYCLNDSKEKQLIAGFHKTHNTRKDAEKRLKRGFTYNFCFQPYSLAENTRAIVVPFATIQILYTPGAIDIHSPPPKTV